MVRVDQEKKKKKQGQKGTRGGKPYSGHDHKWRTPSTDTTRTYGTVIKPDEIDSLVGFPTQDKTTSIYQHAHNTKFCCSSITPVPSTVSVFIILISVPGLKFTLTFIFDLDFPVSTFGYNSHISNVKPWSVYYSSVGWSFTS